MVHYHVNHSLEVENWMGWQLLWKLLVVPRVRTFTSRMMLHGRTPTYEYLYHLNIGPCMMCIVCDQEVKTAKHVIWKCRFSRSCWVLVKKFAGIRINGRSDLVDGPSWPWSGSQGLKVNLLKDWEQCVPGGFGRLDVTRLSIWNQLQRLGFSSKLLAALVTILGEWRWILGKFYQTLINPTCYSFN